MPNKHCRSVLEIQIHRGPWATDKEKRRMVPRGTIHIEGKGGSAELVPQGLAGSYVESPGPLARRRVTFAPHQDSERSIEAHFFKIISFSNVNELPLFSSANDRTVNVRRD